MILFQLRCHQGHDFEAWFLDGGTYDRQSASGNVTCPFCGTINVAKAPMAPNIASGNTDAPLHSGPEEVRARKVAESIFQAVDDLREEVEKNCDYVGDEFADEARRIHFDEAEERGIYGEATEEEAEKLDEESVEFFRLPFPRRRSD